MVHCCSVGDARGTGSLPNASGWMNLRLQTEAKATGRFPASGPQFTCALVCPQNELVEATCSSFRTILDDGRCSAAKRMTAACATRDRFALVVAATLTEVVD